MENSQDEKILSQQLAQRLKKSYAVIDALEAKLTSERTKNAEPIAIVGMACRLPGGVNSPSGFWQLLSEGNAGISEVPKGRWDVDHYYGATARGEARVTSRYGGFIDQVDLFDAHFFGISPKEAIALDPQQRILLEVVWQALEEGNCVPETLYGSETGVYVAMSGSDYMLRQAKYVGEEKINAYFGTGNAHAAACGRIAYVLGLQGPCFAVDTACSSSLVALHNAVVSLRNNEVSAAIVASANLNLTPDVNLAFSAANMLAPDGRCKTFDQAADGYVRGEGIAAVVLKRLGDALKDGDHIHAVVRGSALNQDGASSGLTVPNGVAQQDVIRKALKNANLNALDISYVEAHGTGTALGDPIEVAALGAVYCQQRDKEKPLFIGSAKTNIGHTEASAGLAGLIKVVMSLKHRELPKHLNFDQPSKLIPWGEYPIQVVAEKMQWQCEGERIAGLSSFGFGGSNAHVIISEAPAVATEPNVQQQKPAHILKITAKSAQSLNDLCKQYHNFLHMNNAGVVPDFIFTANTARSDHPFRRVIVGADREALIEQLEQTAPHATHATHATIAQENAPVAFLFSGQGAQYWGMGATLYQAEPHFKAAIDECEEHLRAHMDKPLREVLWGTDQQAIGITRYTQPALFSLEYALAQLWQSWGVTPDILLGHSVGEYVAACIAGVFSLADALALVSARGRLMVECCAPGSMAVVFAKAEIASEFFVGQQQKISIAAYNGPANTVLSGEPDALAIVLQKIESAGIKIQRLNVSHAFHSPMMEPMLEQFRKLARSIHYNKPQYRLISNVTGLICTDELSCADYWVQHVSAPVDFMRSIETLVDENIDVLVELGPHNTLLGMAKYIVNDYVDSLLQEEARTPLYLPSLVRGKDDPTIINTALGAAYCAGVNIDWAKIVAGSGRKMDIPTYPFARKRYWYKETEQQNSATQLNESEQLWLRALRDGSINCLAPLLDGFDEHNKNNLAAVLQQLSLNHNNLLHRYGYSMEWKVAHLNNEKSNLGTSLLIVDDPDDITALTQAMTARGARLLIVIADDNNELVRQHDNLFRFDIRNAQLWKSLFDILNSKAVVLDHCIFYRRHGHADIAAFSYSYIAAFSAITCMALQCQTLLLTRGVALIDGQGDKMDAGHACVMGASRALVAEAPDNFFASLDLDGRDNFALTTGEAAAILTCLASSQYEDLMALRNGEFYVPRLNPLNIPSPKPFTINPDATYLITGAFGGIGACVAEWLIKKGVKKLALASRRGMDSAAVVDSITRWQTLGVECHMLQVDVSDYVCLQDALQAACDQLGEVKGVFHCAGVSGSLCDSDALGFSEYQSVLLPKVQGSLNLQKIIAERGWNNSLDIFVNFSSIASVWGAAGQAGYCAANYFVDTLGPAPGAKYRYIPLNWGPWKEAGMASQMDTGGQMSRIGVEGFDSVLAIALLEQVLAADIQQAVLADINWQTFVPIVFARRKSGLLQELVEQECELAVQDPERGPLRGEFMAQAPEKRKDFLIDVVCRYLRRACQLDEGDVIDPKQGFFDSGVDSLLAVEIKQILQQDLGIKLSSTLLFDYPTPLALAAHLFALLEDVIAAPTLQNQVHDESLATNKSTIDVSQLSDEDVEALLLAKLSSL